jgi:hypothetical protein
MIDAKQFGALKGKSTIHEQVDLLRHWNEALDKNTIVRALFIDYAKAFNHVNHITVIKKTQRPESVINTCAMNFVFLHLIVNSKFSYQMFSLS